MTRARGPLRSPELAANPSSNEHYGLAQLLRDIPVETAERLLIRHWAGLKSVPLFIQAALYIGTDGCRALVPRSAAGNRSRADSFKHISSFFGFQESGLSDRITIRHLETLLPYLSQLDDIAIGSIAVHCRRFGQWDWAVQYIQPELRRRAQTAPRKLDDHPPYVVRMALHLFPTDEELVAELDRIEQEQQSRHRGSLSVFWENSIERGDDPNRPIKVLEDWVRRSPTSDRVRIAAMAVAGQGKRSDIQIVRRYYDPTTHCELAPCIADMEYAVRRRSLE